MSQAVELTADMVGQWLVVTQGSSHIWNLDDMTYVRQPGPNSRAGAFDYDGQVVKLTQVDRWPKVGETSFIWYDDPTAPDTHEQWRQSSTIVSITPLSAESLDPVPLCPVCGHEHTATWEGSRLLATGPCYCGCMIETVVRAVQEGSDE